MTGTAQPYHQCMSPAQLRAALGVDIPALYAGMGGTASITPDSHPAIANAANDEFEVGSVLDTVGTRFIGATPWTFLNPGAAIYSVGQGALTIQAELNSAIDMNCCLQPLPGSGGWNYVAKMSVLQAQNFNNGGMLLQESGTGKIVRMNVFNNGGVANTVGNISLDAAVTYLPSPTGGAGTTSPVQAVTNLPGYFNSTPWVYLRAFYDPIGNTLQYALSANGYAGGFYQMLVFSPTTYFTTFPDHIGLYSESQNASNPSSSFFDFFRRNS